MRCREGVRGNAWLRHRLEGCKRLLHGYLHRRRRVRGDASSGRCGLLKVLILMLLRMVR